MNSLTPGPDITIAEKLQTTATAKSNIATAITNKGGTVPTKFVDYGTAIANLPSGTNKLPSVADKSITTLTASDLNGASTIGAYAFYECALTSVVLPSGITEIGDYAFYNCGGLESITIPDSVTSIGDSSFFSCGSSPIFDFGTTRTTIPSIVSSTFDGIDATFYVPADLVEDWQTEWDGLVSPEQIVAHP